METFISILRGINVSGHKSIQMTDLKTLYAELGLKEAITYIQSGNVIFKTEVKISNQRLSAKIEQAIHKKYNFDVPVIIRTIEEIKHAISVNPFLKETNIDLERVHVTFLAENPEQHSAESIRDLDYSPDKFMVIGKEIYLYCPNGYGTTKLSNTFFEHKLKVSATTRNWKTVNKLVELAGNH